MPAIAIRLRQLLFCVRSALGGRKHCPRSGHPALDSSGREASLFKKDHTWLRPQQMQHRTICLVQGSCHYVGSMRYR